MKYKGIPEYERLEEWLSLGISFEYNDFMLPKVLEDSAEKKRRIQKYLELKRDRSNDTLHGPFLDIAVHSQDPQIRRVSDYRIRQVCDIAERLEAKAVILHTNLIPNFYEPNYRKGWVNQNEEYLRKLLKDYPSLEIYMENMFDEEPDCLVTLAERMQDERFGICLDIAHAHISKTDIDTWLKQCEPYVAEYHINDNDGRIDSHLPVGDGQIPWNKVLSKLNVDVTTLVEVSDLEKFKRSMDYLNGGL